MESYSEQLKNTVDGRKEIHIETPILGKILERSVVNSKYPPSEMGQRIKERFEQGEIDPLLVPTVENPQADLYENLNLADFQDVPVFADIANIQVTKGCRHQCTFCAAGAEKTVETMPFQAIVKIADALKIEDIHKRELRKRHREEFLVAFDRFLELKKLRPRTDDHFRTMFFLALSREKITYQELVEKVPYFELFYKPSSMANPHEFEDDTGPKQMIQNYYDSDPFDYRDNNFLHENGDPADFGDVARLLVSSERAVHVTTAGWSKTDKVAQRAAEKVAMLGKENIYLTRLSVSPFDIRARKKMEKYIEDTVNSLRTLLPLHPEILFFGEEAFKEKIMEALTKESSELLSASQWPLFTVSDTPTSNFSGAAKDNEMETDSDHDVMACMPGYHIWPGGDVAFQKKGTFGWNAPDGSRPTAIGKKIWSVSRDVKQTQIKNRY